MKWAEVEPDIRRLHVDYLWLKVESCLTFASVAAAKYELHKADAKFFLDYGEREYLSLLRAFAESDLPNDSKREMQWQIAGVRDRLNEVKLAQLEPLFK